MDSYPRSPSHSAQSRPTPARRRTRVKGKTAELVVWRIIKGEGHGEHRERVGNYRIEGFEQFWEVNHPGEGRYRIESRDSNGTIVRVRYANAPAPGEGPPRFTKGRYRPSRRTMPTPLPAWLPPARPFSVRVYNRSGVLTDRTRVEELHELPEPPPWNGQNWVLRINGVWETYPDVKAISPGYKAMRLYRDRWVWVPVFSDGWVGFYKARNPRGELYFLPNNND